MSLRLYEMASWDEFGPRAIVCRPLNQTKMEFTNSRFGENSNIKNSLLLISET